MRRVKNNLAETEVEILVFTKPFPFNIVIADLTYGGGELNSRR